MKKATAMQAGEVYGTISGHFHYIPVKILFHRASLVYFTWIQGHALAELSWIM